MRLLPVSGGAGQPGCALEFRKCSFVACATLPAKVPMAPLCFALPPLRTEIPSAASCTVPWLGEKGGQTGGLKAITVNGRNAFITCKITTTV